MFYASTKPDSPARSFLVGFLTSYPNATFAEAREAASHEGLSIGGSNWAQARRELGQLLGTPPGREAPRPLKSAAEPRPEQRSSPGDGGPVAEPQPDPVLPEPAADHTVSRASEVLEPQCDPHPGLAPPQVEPEQDALQVAEPLPARRSGRAPARPRRVEPAALVSIPLAIESDADLETWQTVVQRLSAGARFVLEYRDRTWSFKEQP